MRLLVPYNVQRYFDNKEEGKPQNREVVEQAAAVLVSYGSSDDAFLDILLRVAEPKGKLPFNLVRSDKAAKEQIGNMLFNTVAAVQVRP